VFGWWHHVDFFGKLQTHLPCNILPAYQHLYTTKGAKTAQKIQFNDRQSMEENKLIYCGLPQVQVHEINRFFVVIFFFLLAR
jgi:hypothetical protein